MDQYVLLLLVILTLSIYGSLFFLSRLFKSQQESSIYKLENNLSKLEKIVLSTGSLVSESENKLKNLVLKVDTISSSNQLLVDQQETVKFILHQVITFNEVAKDIKEQNIVLRKLSENICTIHEITCKTNDNDMLKEILNIRSSLQVVNQELNSLIRIIVDEVKNQQNNLMEVVEKKFVEEINKSRDILVSSIEKELITISSQPNSKGEILNRLVSLVEYSLKGMGEFQRANMRTETEVIITLVEENVRKSVNDISNEIKELKQKVENISYLLPEPN